MILFKQETVKLLNDVSQTILNHGVEHGINEWRDMMQKRHDCAPECLYNNQCALKRCGFCLEASLRTLNLYHRTSWYTECTYLEAARVICAHPDMANAS